MPYFTELHAPDLSSLGPPLAARLINALLFQGKQAPTDSVMSRLLTGYVIVSDKAIREYSAGRETLRSYAQSNNQIELMIEGVGRMETSINSAKRALRFLGRIGTTKSLLSVDRTLRRLAQSPEKALTSIRDAIEHIDAEITSPKTLPQGEAHLLAIDHAGEYLEISSHKVSFAALARSLSALHKTGEQILDALPQVRPTGAS